MNAAAKELIARSHFGSPAFTLEGANVHLQGLASSMCSNPVKVLGYDRYTDSQRYYYASCGHCFNCRNLKGNELTVRFYHDATILKHAYFITLTYPSYETYESIPSVLTPCFWHYDCYNHASRWCWSPCMLYYPHIQAYLKLLRTRLTRHFGEVPYLEIITTGELGHRFGRPHWHLLIISNKQLTKDLIYQPWIDTIQTESTRIDFVDIIANGTLEARPNNMSNTIAVKKNVKHCVKYLVKYTQKSDLKHVNTTRLAWALPYFQSLPLYPDDVPSLGPNICFTPTKYHYDKTQSLFKVPRGYQKPRIQSYSEITLRDLFSMFGTKHQSSTNNAIGKLYALQNCERFASGNKSVKSVPLYTPVLTGTDGTIVPKLEQTSFQIFPSYYARITQRYQFPLSLCKKTAKGSIQYNFVNMSRLRASYSLLLRLANSVYLCRSSVDAQPYSMLPTTIADLDFFRLQLSESELSVLFPAASVKNKTTLGRANNYWQTSYFYDRSSKTRFAPYTLFDIVDDFVVPVGFCFCAQTYSGGHWSSPKVVDLDDVLKSLAIPPLNKYKQAYLRASQEMDLFVSLIDSISGTPEYLSAVQQNEDNWQSFKIKINKQTIKLNAYD